MIRTSLIVVFAALVLLFTAGCGARSPMLQNADAVAIDRARAAVSPALVRIHAVRGFYSEGRARRMESTGSGVIVSPDGLVVTNHHVAADAVRLFVTMPNREELPARLIGTDALTDIAVIQITPPTPRRFAFAEWGDSDPVRVGDTVFAMGSPLSLSQSITKGIVSNTQMTLPQIWGDRIELDGEDVGSMVTWLGHDATIFPGNSGGPLVDGNGRVIGINEISYGLAGAIPSNVARPVAEKLVRHGAVPRAHLGLVFQPQLKGMAARDGALVASVLRDSPAAQAGIRPGDFLLAMDGAPVRVVFLEELPALNNRVAGLPTDREVVLTVESDGARRDVSVTPVPRERVIQPEAELREWGIAARDLSIWTAIDMSRETREGVLVTSVRPGGAAGAAKPALRGRDVIVAVNDESVRTVEDLRAVTARLMEGRSEKLPVIVTFDREGERMVTVPELGIDELDDPGREVAKAWVPVATQPITRELARALGKPEMTGVRVTQVFGGASDSPLPLEVGDLVLTMDGEPLPVAEPQDADVFATLVRQYRIGTPVRFTLLRGGEEKEVVVALPARPATPREMKRYRNLDLEFTVRETAFIDTQRPGWRADAPSRVLVDSVTSGGTASLARLSVGDRILELDGRAVQGIADVEAILADVRTRRADFVSVKVQRGSQTLFLEFEPIWNP